MNLFLKKVILFIGTIIGILMLSLGFNKVYLKANNFFSLNNNIHILILGDSHTRYGLDDKYLEKTKNLSNDADSYFYSYVKLKELKENNPQIDTLFLSFSKHNIDKSIESRWLLNNSHLKERLLLYYPILDQQELLFLLNNKPIETIKNLFSQVLSPYKYFTKKLESFGGYKDLGFNKLQKEIAKNKNEGEKNIPFQEATIEKLYLRKIADYCKVKHITLILINMPCHKTLRDNKDEFYNFYKNYFSDITLLDFKDIELADDNFGDLVHLTPKGSEYFTKKIFMKHLQKGGAKLIQ